MIEPIERVLIVNSRQHRLSKQNNPSSSFLEEWSETWSKNKYTFSFAKQDSLPRLS